MKYLLIFLFFPLTSWSQDCTGCSTNQAASADPVSALLETVAQVKGCNPQQSLTIHTAKENLKSELEDLYKKILKEKLRTNPEHPPAIKKELLHALKIMDCVKLKIDKVPLSCVQSRAGDRTIAQGGKKFIIFSDTVRILNNFFGYAPKTQSGIVLHEFTHVCGTDDLIYYPPFGVRQGADRWEHFPGLKSSFKHWSQNADLYRWWYENGFCIPKINCQDTAWFNKFPPKS
jgi:hypothetical protein